MAEIWTATTAAGEHVAFDVLDEVTGENRQEIRSKDELLLMLVLGGYPEQAARLMISQSLTRRFRKDGSDIFLDMLADGDDQESPDAD